MRRNVDPPFYPGEIVTGRVLKLKSAQAILNVRGWTIPLDKRLIGWDVLYSPAEVLSVGENIKVVIQTHACCDPVHKKVRTYFDQCGEFWISRLPLLENPWPELAAKYPDGSVVEVEMVNYTAPHTARARFPEGLLVEVPLIGLARYARQKNQPVRRLHPKEQFSVMVRGSMPLRYWLQPCFGKHGLRL